MAQGIEVPVTPSVLRWAIEESGYTAEEIAHAVAVPLMSLEEWASGKRNPSLTQARKLASKLHRPFAALLLPAPPQSRPLHVQFRHPLEDQRELNPQERRHLRRAVRLQEMLSWLAGELGIGRPKTPSASLQDDPARVADVTRGLLRISTADQEGWKTHAVAFDQWRATLEQIGHVVFLFSLGKESSRGFSLWDELAPVAAVNTAWNESARIFTLFHEMAHLITRTSSACVEAVRTTGRTDPVERWCEKFAADLLMPTRDVELTLRQHGWHPGAQITNLSVASDIANRYKVSLRAAVIRLIELNAAGWNLYDQIPPVSDKKVGGGGGTGRSRAQIREDQFGDRVTSLFVAAVEKEVLSRSQAVEFLDIPDTAFDDLTRTGRRKA